MSQEAEEIFNRQYECEWDKLNKLEIDITNPTGLPQFINLFAFSLQDVAVQYPSLIFADPTSYNILVQDLEYNPIKARKILFASTSQGQLANAATVQRKYADGTADVYTEFPIISVDTQQRQGNRVEVVFDELILDGFTTFSSYRINAGDTVTILLYYRQLKRWCIVDFPELFPERKKITPEITQKIVEEFCEREKDARDQDQDWICKKGKKQFELTITNNGSTQQFVNLFDNYSLIPAEDLTAPINTLTTNPLANFSFPKFEQWLTGNKEGYTIGGAGIDEIVRYDKDANFVIERAALGFPTTKFSISNSNSKLYYTHSGFTASLYIYQLGSGLAPTSILIGGSPDSVVVDDVNNFVFIISIVSVNMVRVDQNSLAITTFILPVTPTSEIIGFYSTSSAVLYQAPELGLNRLYSMDALSGVSTLRDTYDAGEAISDIVDMANLGLFAVVTQNVGVYKVILYDSSYSRIGTYTTAVQLNVISYDTTRNELIVPERGGLLRILFLTQESLINNSIDSSYSLGFFSNNTGYLAGSQTVMIGRKGFVSVSTLNRSPTIQFSNPESYNYFTESLGEEPVKVSCMDVIASTQQQLVNNLVIQTKDADGHVSSQPKSPIVRVDTEQEQSGRAFLIMEEDLILDANTTFTSYPLNAGETVTMVYYYHQFKRASLLSDDNPRRVKIKTPEPIIDYGEYDKIYNYEKHQCQEECKKIEIKVTNASGADALFNFFLANQNTLIVNQLNATFDNVEDYNYLIQQLRDSPLVLCGMEVIGSNQDQLTEPIIVATVDADGNDFAYQHFPINYVDTNQKDGARVFVKTNHILIDGYTLFPYYNIRAGSSITFVLYYRQFMRSDFLSTYIYPILRKPIVSNGSQVSDDIEYYNDITHLADNTWNFDGISKKGEQNMHQNSEKSVIFDAEQVYSDSFTSKRSDFLVPFFKKVRVKYKEKRANCEIPKPDKQILYVNPNDLSFGKETDFPVKDISEQGYSQFKNNELTAKPIGERDMIDLSQQEDQKGIGYRNWSYRTDKEHFVRSTGQDFVLKTKIKPNK